MGLGLGAGMRGCVLATSEVLPCPCLEDTEGEGEGEGEGLLVLLVCHSVGLAEGSTAV